MKLFNKNKPIDVAWHIDNKLDFIEVSKGFFKNIKKYNISNTIGCPAVSSSNNRIYYVNSPLDITFEIEKNSKTNSYEYKYVYENSPYTNKLSNAINNMITLDVNNKNVISFQFTTPYIFRTDYQDIELFLTPPNIETENVQFVTGAFNITNWLRPISSAWIILDPSKKAVIKYKKNKPLYFIVFNKNINLQYKELSEEANKYYRNTFMITKFVSNVSSYFADIVERRPKKLL